MAERATVRLRADRRGIVYRGTPIDGFPDLDTVSAEDRLRIARWAKSLAPGDMSTGQRQLLAEQRGRRVSTRRREGISQDRWLRSPLVRGLWRSLGPHEQDLVLNPDTTLDKRYPLSTNELARLTGLTRRQVQHWSDRRLLPHWTDERGYRLFEAPAAIVAFALRARGQHERQFYADIGRHTHPLAALREVVSIVGMRTLDLAQGAEPDELAEAEEIFRAVAESLHALRAEPAGEKPASRSTA
jgi:MerR HTH family regulatory protein